MYFNSQSSVIWIYVRNIGGILYAIILTIINIKSGLGLGMANSLWIVLTEEL